jgi:hypothetical protein
MIQKGSAKREYDHQPPEAMGKGLKAVDEVLILVQHVDSLKRLNPRVMVPVEERPADVLEVLVRQKGRRVIHDDPADGIRALGTNLRMPKPTRAKVKIAAAGRQFGICSALRRGLPT